MVRIEFHTAAVVYIRFRVEERECGVLVLYHSRISIIQTIYRVP